MIEWLIQQSVLISLLSALLLSLPTLLGKQVSAQTLYRVWLLVPVSLLVSVLLPFFSISSATYQFSVLVKQSAQVVEQADSGANLVLILWLVGASVLCANLLLSYLHFYRRYALDCCEKQTIQLGHQRYTVRVSNQADSPFVVGFIAPQIVLPADFQTRYTANQQALILRHEQLHIQRGDLRWSLLAQALVMLFWFNPLVWLAYRQFRQTQELACDEAVIARQSRACKADYANALVQASRSQTHPPYLIHYGEKTMLKNRLSGVLNPANSKAWKNITALLALSFIALSATWATAGNHQEKGASGVPLKRFEPLYPPQAAKQGIEGSVVLQFDIETDGSVSNVQVVQSQPAKVFDRNASAAVAKWVYAKHTSKLHGVTVQLDFVLSESSAGKRIDEHKSDTEMVLVQGHN